MYKYIMIGKLSIEFSSSMVGKPQNRTEIVTPFFENLGGKLLQMLYTNHPEMNAIAFKYIIVAYLLIHLLLPLLAL